MKANKNIYFIAIALAVLVNIFSWSDPFFWDTILTSTITQHFYSNGFHGFITPAALDAGHPPLFYIYVTLCYHVLGKSLFAAHLAMLPFTILGVVSFVQLLKYFSFSSKQQLSGVVLFFSIPAVITQNILVSYDAVLLSLYLAVLATYIRKQKLFFTIVLIGIAGISLRGLFCLAALSISIYFLEHRDFKKWFKWNLLFVPAVLLIACWYIYHYTQTGWFFATPSQGWNGQRGLVDAHGIFKNGISIARCFFDLGIVFLSLFNLVYLVRKRKLNNFTLLWLIPMLVFSVGFLPFTNPINHRYYLIVYVLMLLPLLRFLSAKKTIYTLFAIVILILGNLQIYPVPISNGWDCTLAHLSYDDCMNDFYFMNNREKFVDRNKTGTVFPMSASLYQTEMSEDTLRMHNVNGESIAMQPYILYSNVGNDFSDEQIHELQYWQKIATFHHGLVTMTFYGNPFLAK